MTEIALTVDSNLSAERSRLIEEVGRAGFSAIGLGIPDARATEPRELESAGLRCHELMALGFGDDLERTLQGAELVAETAAGIGAEWVLGYFSHFGSDAKEQVRRASEILSAGGSRMALEFTGVASPTRLNDVRELVAAAVPGSAGVLVDSWHVSFGDPRNWDELRDLPVDEIAYVQFNDHGVLDAEDRLGESMHRRLWPGAGSLELERFVDLLRGKDWDGVVSVEVLNAEYRKLPLEEYCAEAYRTTAQYWL